MIAITGALMRIGPRNDDSIWQLTIPCKHIG